ncbi:MAG: hypothetical protein MI723_12350 [Caulobacterales bacterium]|nr:hypothetical protein [Caulobacterales bacterium]
MTTTRIHERHDRSFGFYFEACDVLEIASSPFQEIKVINTAEHGRILLIDGLTMLTEHTHHVYHEHMAHIPLACAREARTALVVGGGDGGVVTELVKHASLERIVLAEIDETVIDVSRRWFPDVAAGLDDPRVEIRIGDGAAYMGASPGAFDVIIVDSTDICDEAHEATDIASPLATEAFQADMRRALRPGGVGIQILGSPTFYRRSMARIVPWLKGQWPRYTLVRMACPFYITGEWASGLFTADGALQPTRFPLPPGALRYLTPDVARGALALPGEFASLLEPAQETVS